MNLPPKTCFSRKATKKRDHDETKVMYMHWELLISIGNKQSCVLYRQCLFFKVNSEMRNKVLKINASNIADLYLIYHFLIKQFFQGQISQIYGFTVYCGLANREM